MIHLKKYNESFKNDIQDIKDTLVDLKDEGWIVEQGSFVEDPHYDFKHEFIIYKIGESKYYINNNECELFSIDEIKEYLLRFIDICTSNKENPRIVVHDGEFIIDITNKISKLSSVDSNDVLGKTHLHFKKVKHIDLDNIKFCCLQLLK